jgi:hypothetical protein
MKNTKKEKEKKKKEKKRIEKIHRESKKHPFWLCFFYPIQ